MCIIIFSQRHPDYKLILISNRDEYFARETKPLHPWPRTTVQRSNARAASDISIIAGQDAVRGGAWLAVSTTGKFAALTNFRRNSSLAASEQAHLEQSAQQEDDRRDDYDEDVVAPVSRGYLPLSYITSDHHDTTTTYEYLQKMSQLTALAKFDGFSLLCCDLTKLDKEGISIISNHHDPRFPEPVITVHANDGTKALSNSLFGDHWPKTRLGVELLDRTIDCHRDLTSEDLRDQLFELLSTDTLKQPFVGPEDLATSIFIPRLDIGSDKAYGTRQQTVLLLDHAEQLELTERTIDNEGQKTTVRQVINL